MQEYKIIFAGSMGAGKSSAVRALSEIDIVNTDVINTDRQAHSKLTTTVGIDYGQIFLPPDVKIGLYGTPGQERFEAIWRIITQGALGAIILVDASSEKSTEELVFYIDYFLKSDIKSLVIGLTHCDQAPENIHLTMDECMKIMAKHDMLFPAFIVDARRKEDVLLLVDSLLTSIESTL